MTVDEVVVGSGAGGGGGEVGVVVVVVMCGGFVIFEISTRTISLSAPAPTDVALTKPSPVKLSVQL